VKGVACETILILPCVKHSLWTKLSKGHVFMSSHPLTSASQCIVGSQRMLSTCIAWLCVYDQFFFPAQIHAASTWGRMCTNWLMHIQVSTISVKISTLRCIKLIIAGFWCYPYLLYSCCTCPICMHKLMLHVASVSFEGLANRTDWRSLALWRVALFPGSLIKKQGFMDTRNSSLWVVYKRRISVHWEEFQ